MKLPSLSMFMLFSPMVQLQQNFVMRKHMENKEIASPCVRNCCLNNQDMCVGCFRMLDEIVGWGQATSIQRKSILLKCGSRAERSASMRVEQSRLTR
ncbi:MAG: DUF1289 domain-containing protein [Paraglaciecola polaris]